MKTNTKTNRKPVLPDHNQPELPMSDRDGDRLPVDTAVAVKRLANAILAGNVTITAGGAS